MGELKKQYGLLTAISMVVGCVIGSGVFFKAETVSRVTGGNVGLGIAAWGIGGGVMLLCLLSFARLSSIYTGQGGVILYAKETVGCSYAYYMGWFMATIYYPSLVSVLSWLSARYTLLFLGIENESGGLCMLLSCIFLVISFAQNSFSPVFSGKVQVVTTVIKLIPLILMMLLGITKGITSGILWENFADRTPGSTSALFGAITATAFAYEGWIAATTIGGELKNSRKNLPLALILGGGLVALVYVMYYIGICGAVRADILINNSHQGIRLAFDNIVGKGVGDLLIAFVAVSCYGALNGLTLGNGRAMYNLASTQKTSLPKPILHIDPYTGMSTGSCVAGLLLSMGWLFFYYGARISDTPLFMGFGFDSSELSVISAYAMYIPIFLMFIKKQKKSLKNVFLLICGIAACIFLIICAVYAHKNDLTDYILTFTSIMLIGSLFYRGK